MVSSVDEIKSVEAVTPDVAKQPVLSGKNRICIITSAPICCNPRVVKEADALTAAGFNVRVVASQHVEWVVAWDRELMLSRKWKHDPVRWDGTDFNSKRIRLMTGLRQRSFQVLAKGTPRSKATERAFARLYDTQLAKAITEKADLYIAHNPAALPVAAAAADRFGVSFAFDSEDFHSGEFTAGEQDSESFRLLSNLEAKYLHRCVYVTVSSEQIADALAERYSIPRPTVIHNVFSWSERTKLDGKIKDRRGEALSLYWYSQIVGLNRGLQDAIRAVSLLTQPVQLHIRGDASSEVKDQLLQLAAECSVTNVFFHSPVPPDELLSRAVEHDIGLALEQPVNINRSITVTNKLFFYLLAGLGLAATNTEGQRAIMQNSPEVGFVYEAGDHRALALELQKLIDSPALLGRRKTAALNAARERWNWEEESRRLVEAVSSALSGKKGISLVS
jgi:glycosyltransferase involved in cell wall biosynthesis